jgi:iron complex outermembrane receptor protein
MAGAATTFTFGSTVALSAQPDDADNGGLETVVVTSQKRSESSQRVPLTVKAFDENALKAQGIENVTDLANAVPGFAIQKISGAAYPFLRGIGLQSSGPWQEAPVATFIDGVYYLNASINNAQLNNLERVEVIKGPQGTLFGRNALGGVIQYITKDPSHVTSANVELGYGNYDTWSGNLYATTGITDNIAADIAIVAEQQLDGWGTNLVTGRDEHTAYKFSFRSKWVWTPTDKTKVTWSADYGRATSAEAGNGSVRDVYPFITEGPHHVGGFYDTYFPGRAYELSTQAGGSIKVEHDFGWAQFLSISAHRRSPRIVNGPDPFDVPYLSETPAVGQISSLRTSNLGYTFSRATTQEFQLTSPGSSAFRWVVGTFLLRDSSGEAEKNDVRVVPPTGVINNRSRTQQDTESYSGFGEVTVPLFTDSTRLTGGIRYTSDHRSVHGFGSTNSMADPDVFVVRPGTTEADNPVPSKTWSKSTYKLSLEQDISQDVLAYATFSTGFQSAFYAITNDANRPPLDPVTMDAIEIGVKSDFFDNRVRVNASAFRYNIDNLIVSAFANGSQNQRNAAKSRIKGIDLDLAYRPIRNLTLSAAMQYLDPIYTDYPNALVYSPDPAKNVYVIGPGDVTGQQMQWSEKFMGTTTANYRIPTTFGDFRLTGTYAYHSGTHFDTQDLNTQPAYSLLNASIGWTSPDAKLEVDLWGKNLLDEVYVSAFQIGTTVMKYTPAEPRTYGVRFGYSWQ